MRQINKNEGSQKSSLSGIRKTINIIISLIILFIVSNTMYIIDFSEFVNNQTLILPQPFSQDKKIVIPAKSTLGVAYESFLNYYVYNSSYNSLRIKAVFPGSSAEEAGLKAGDQIIDIEGKPITTIEEMEEIVASHSGEEISISYIRDGVIYQKWLTSNIFKISLETMIGAQDVIYEDFYISKKLANKK
jgi:membrane-associated protease RseP (regulator of RpoE activity)